MRAWLGIIAVLAGLLSAFAAQAGEPFARARVITDPPFQVGQPIKVEIQVLAPNYFLSAVNFPTLTIPGAIVAPPDTRPLNFTEKVGEDTYSGIRQLYSVVPQQSGALALPPIKIDFTYAAVPGQASQGSVTIPPQSFDVVMLTGAVDTGGAGLEISQTFDRDPATLKSGDALTRTVTIVSKSRPAMMIAPLRSQAPSGVKLYRHDPVLTDDKDGSGRRTERLTYEFPDSGNYVLPSISAGGASTPEVKVQVVPAPASGTAIIPEGVLGQGRLARIDWGFWLPRALGIAAAASLVVVLWVRYRNRLRAAGRAGWANYRQSEPAYFARLTAACRTQDRMAVYHVLQSWSACAGIRSLERWAGAFGRPALQSELTRLDRDLFAGSLPAAAWSADLLAAELTAARKKWRRSDTTITRTTLPNLN